MTRYPGSQKRGTRERILTHAARRFKRDGVDRSGIATVMSDASLTNGAFYTHFTSKDDLVGTVVRDQLRAQRERYGAVRFDRSSFEAFVRDYLSMAHRDDLEGGCPSAAMLGDIIHGSPGTRMSYREGTLPMIEDIAATIPGVDRAAAQVRAAAVFAAMVGILQMARAVDDDRFVQAILSQGAEDVLAQLDHHISCAPTSSSTARTRRS